MHNTGQGEQLIAYEDCSLVLVLVERILSPFLEEPLHTCNERKETERTNMGESWAAL